MYSTKQFRSRKFEKIRRDIDSVSQIDNTITKIFLADGNAMVMPSKRMLEVLNYLTASFPNLRRITAYALASGSALYFPFGLYHAIRFDYSAVTIAAWGSVAYMAVGLSLVVYVLWYWVLKYMDASRIAVFHNVQPVLATVVSVLWLGERLTGTFMVGGLVVLAGVIIAETKRKT